MKLTIEIPEENRNRHFCVKCQKETIREIQKKGAPWYICESCAHEDSRVLAFGKNARMHKDSEGVLWHESVAVFVIDREGKILCFERTRFPEGKITIPAGHAEQDKSIEESAFMELEEESGIGGVKIQHIDSVPIHNDSCSWGADDHIWHTYVCHVGRRPVITLNHEGRSAHWLSRKAILHRDCVIGVRYFLENYKELLS